jgi:phosphatidylglycerophosphate synthase
MDRHLAIVARRLDLNPNLVTTAGLAVTAVAAVVLVQDLFIGGLIVMLAAFLDVLDGAVARAHNRATRFGAFLDSVLDRYADALILLGLAGHFYRTGSFTGIALSLGTLVGALLVSYTRARAEGLGGSCHTGLMERAERILLIVFGALTGWMLPVMWILCILTHVTVLQRIWYVRGTLK